MEVSLAERMRGSGLLELAFLFFSFLLYLDFIYVSVFPYYLVFLFLNLRYAVAAFGSLFRWYIYFNNPVIQTLTNHNNQ